jgi:chromosome segregation ATPase
MPKLRTTEKLQASAQLLADDKADLVRHLESVVTARNAQLATLGEQTGQFQQQLATANDHIRALRAETDRLRSECDCRAGELKVMKNSRSWRWTAWLRAIGL